MNTSLLYSTEQEVSQYQVEQLVQPGAASAWAIEALQIRSEVLTRTSEEILESRPPSRWGINE